MKQNKTDVYLSDDEGTGAREGFEWDFDGDHKRYNVFGSPNFSSNLTLGNNVETTIGGGDSGGPSFIVDGDGDLVVFGINTFTGGGGKAPAPYFGSIGGGIVVSAYASWIESIINDTGQPPTNQPPIADAGPDQAVVTDSQVQLNGSGSSDPDGGSLNYSWTLDAPEGSGAVLSDPTAANPTFIADLDGSYVATLIVNDGQADSGPDSVTITAGAAGTSLHVGDIDGSSQVKGKSGKWSAGVTVTIHDDNHNPVSGALVSGQWSGAAGGPASGITAADGSVTFSTGNLNGGTSVTFDVTDVTHALDYESGGNHDPDGDGDSDGTSITVNREGAGRAVATIELLRDAPATRGAAAFPWRQESTQPSATQRDDSTLEEAIPIGSSTDLAIRHPARTNAVRADAADRVLAGEENSTADDDELEGFLSAMIDVTRD